MATPEKIKEWGSATQAEQDASMEKWHQWTKQHKKDIVEVGSPLGKSMRVDMNGVSDTSNEICGYTIVETDLHKAAAAIFSDNPFIKEGDVWIDVMQFGEM